ncbi:ATP synthase F0 subunit 6 (mitochondrion) [Capricornis sumatraensis]|uniref:ATP synthase subunit a n=8 Tax=Capricornis TaxID=9965 RepID=A0A8T9ICY2_9CETA|nr:ATP synthase F0 subunit 6 [Capricornis sumatraensis]YP_009253223.1 ATP synthase F0 subunit 6 [Capricornis sp. YZ-2016]AIE11302.1 ATPase subunit 6 [Capricornis sp. HD-2014]ALH42375.1 ATP synthase F0 subunit 6 [Capricornis thar jamrachi]QKZ93792.1 ATP synthase F0 subunit 6 [Capricornis milneedwardsii]UNN52174.1 ATP synthase F0 subunit 6 [Capricornis sp. 1 GL-2022]UNN52200.1 ATP synthase F0 subunit 6 [Capricornis sp. 2 GL-2022]UNN52226.1 ATP synthase F0 subunit 6 [Capricornis sp. 3 GL-2022]
MNENLFASFVTPMVLGLPLVTLIVLFPSFLFPTSNRLINNRLISLQQWALQLISKQMMNIHNTKGQTWTLMLMSLILFIGSTNLLGLLPHSFTPTTQLSMNLGMAIPLWAGAVITGFRNKTKTSLAHFLPQGTPTPLIPMLVIIETISLFIQPMALAVRLTANITAGHLLMHLIGGATLALMNISTTAASITFIILILLTILEFAVAMIQAYVFTLLVSLYLHDNT